MPCPFQEKKASLDKAVTVTNSFFLRACTTLAVTNTGLNSGERENCKEMLKGHFHYILELIRTKKILL